jgi:hypothetical protein
MKRTRTKAVGLGLALLAGQLRAADAENDPPADPPAVLPRPLRTGPWTAAPAPDTNLIWLPSRKPGQPPAPAADPPAPQPTPSAAPVTFVAAAPAPHDAAGPRPASGADPFGPLPAIPAVSDTPAEPRTLPTIPAPSAPALPAIPSVPAPPAVNRTAPVAADSAVLPSIPTPGIATPSNTDWQPVPQPQAQPEWTVALDPQAPAPAPRPVDPGRPMTVPQPPAPTQPLPAPRPAEGDRTPRPPAPAEVWGAPGFDPHTGALPTAPPELMKSSPMVAPGKHGTFGSPPIRLSRDYPALADLCGGWLTEQDWGPDSGPATDRYYVQAELLLWWVKTGRVPVLATTTTATQTNRDLLLGFGFLGDPSTRTLFGPGSLGQSFRPGFRVRAGAWFDDCGSCGIDAGFFFLGQRSGSTFIDPSTLPSGVITRPFFSPNLGREFGEQVSLPGAELGTLAIDNRTSIWGADANLRHALCRQCDYRAEVFAGYRFLSLDDRLRISENIVALTDVVPVMSGMVAFPAGTRSVVTDEFATRNRFHGGQVGVMAERQWGRLSLAARGSLALGVTHEELDISGGQLVTRPGQAPMALTGGLLAVGPNLGHFTSNRFAVVPEVSVNLGYWLTPHVKAYVGYDFLYWSRVIRAGEQIDRVVDQSFIPSTIGNQPAFSGQLRPQPLFQQTGFWAHGIQFGLQARW